MPLTVTDKVLWGVNTDAPLAGAPTTDKYSISILLPADGALPNEIPSPKFNS